MPSYLTGVLVAFIEPVVHGWSNIIDSKFSNTVFPKLSVLLFFGMAFNLVFLPFVMFISPPHLLPLPLLGLVFCISLIEVLYLFPYYWSLRTTDTSVVAALFSLGEAMIPIMAFFFLHERLAPIRYIGFGIIIISAIMITLDMKKIRLNASFFLMLAASFILAVEAILYKYIYQQGVSWGSVVVPATLFQLLIAVPFALFAGKDALIDGFSKMKSAGWLFLTNEVLGSAGNLSGSFAIFALPLSVAKAIGATQPAFVLGYAYVFRKKHSDFFKENVTRSDALRKLFFFTLTVIGTILVVV